MKALENCSSFLEIDTQLMLLQWRMKEGENEGDGVSELGLWRVFQRRHGRIYITPNRKLVHALSDRTWGVSKLCFRAHIIPYTRRMNEVQPSVANPRTLFKDTEKYFYELLHSLNSTLKNKYINLKAFGKPHG